MGRTARERASAASRSDLMQKCGEMKSLVETKAYDLAKDQKNSVSRLAFLIDTLRQDLEKTSAQRDKMIEASEKGQSKSLSDAVADLVMRIERAVNDSAYQNNQITDEVSD